MPGDIVDRIDHGIGQTFAILVLVFKLAGFQEAANLIMVETALMLIVGAAYPADTTLPTRLCRAIVAKLRS